MNNFKTNTIITIGYVSNYACYLNISEEEAKKRYSESEEISVDEIGQPDSLYQIEKIHFNNEFGAYSIHETE